MEEPKQTKKLPVLEKREAKIIEEKASKEEVLIEEVHGKLETLEEQLVSYNDSIQRSIDNLNLFYSGFSSKTDELVKNLDKEVSYTRNLENQIAQKKSEYEALELKKALEDDRAKFQLAFDNMRRDLNSGIKKLESWEQESIKLISDELKDYDKKIEEISKVENTITKSIEDYRKDMTHASTQEYNILKGNCEKFLTDSCSTLKQIKTDILVFLKECKKQNEELIKMIPVQKNKLSIKDIFLFTMSGTCIFGMIVQVIGIIIRIG